MTDWRAKVVVTCDRPALLDRSLAAHVREDDDVPLVVVDDGRSPASSRPPTPHAVWVDREQRRRIARRLAGAGGDELLLLGEIDGRSFGTTVGSARNAAILAVDALAGPGLVSFADDDVVPELYRRVACGEDGPVVVHDGRDPSILFVAADRDEVLGAIARVATTRARVVDARGSDVPAVLFGHAGDSGMGRPLFALFQEWGDDAAYRRATTSREVVRAVAQPTLTSCPAFIGLAFALDTRHVLPPFLPCGRNQDGLFGAMLRRLDPRTRFLHVPYLVLHAPEEARAFAPSSVLDARPRLGDVLLYLVAATSRVGDDLGRVGEGLVRLAARRTFLEEVVLARRVAASATRHVLESLLARRARQPTAWASDVTAWMENVERTIADETCAVPSELAGARQPVEWLRELVDRFGRAVAAWPSVRRAATALGRELLTP